MVERRLRGLGSGRGSICWVDGWDIGQRVGKGKRKSKSDESVEERCGAHKSAVGVETTLEHQERGQSSWSAQTRKKESNRFTSLTY